MAPRLSEPDCPLYLETIFPFSMWSRSWAGDVCRRVIPHGSGFAMSAAERLSSSSGLMHTPMRSSVRPYRRRSSVEGGNGEERGPQPRNRLPKWSGCAGNSGRTCSIVATGGSTVPFRHAGIEMGSDHRLYCAGLRTRLTELQGIEVPSTASAAPTVRDELALLEESLAGEERTVTALYQQFESDTAEAESLQQRIESISDDLRKYKDLRKVRRRAPLTSLTSLAAIAPPAIRRSPTRCSIPATRQCRWT